MSQKAKNGSFQSAKDSKQDEFYTQLSDIEKELKHYKKHFKGKVVYCNCDDPRVSNFFHYFSHNFEKLGLKKLISTCYKNQNSDLFTQNQSEKAVYIEYFGDKNANNMPDLDEIGIKELQGDGDFRSAESIELLKQADIVVTNPPFSLFREYVAQLMDTINRFSSSAIKMPSATRKYLTSSKLTSCGKAISVVTWRLRCQITMKPGKQGIGKMTKGRNGEALAMLAGTPILISPSGTKKLFCTRSTRPKSIQCMQTTTLLKSGR